MRRGYTITPTMNAWLVVLDGDFSQIDALGLECPLWVISGHYHHSGDVRFAPKSGHSVRLAIAAGSAASYMPKVEPKDQGEWTTATSVKRYAARLAKATHPTANGRG